MMRLDPRLTSVVRPAVTLIIVVIFWWYITEQVLNQPRIYPTPQGVFSELVKIAGGDSPLGSTYGHALATLTRLLIAFGSAFVLGTLLGTIAGRIKWFYQFANSVVWMALAIPSVVWVFIFLVVFGISDLVPVAALVVLLSAPVFIGTAEGVRSVDRDLLEMSASYQVSTRSRFFELYIPSIIPFMLANARVSFALGIKVVIIAEVIGLPNGIGLLVKYWTDKLFIAPVVAWGLILILFGIIVDRLLFRRLEVHVRRWNTASSDTHIVAQ